jgi:perosamine synthetase
MKTSLSRFLNAPEENLFLFSKGRVALYALLKAMGIGPGDEIIIPGYTCVMVPSAPYYLGATCRYVDIDPATYNLDPKQLDRAFSPRTKALIIQHTYGIAQQMFPVMKWAEGKKLPVIEDCCHAFGPRYKGRLCGTFGVGAFFSGQWNKPFSTGLGGMLLVNNGNFLPALNTLYAEAAAPAGAEELLLAAQIKAYNALVTPRTVSRITLMYRGLTRMGLVKGSSSNDEFAGKMPADYFKKMARCQIKEGERNFKRLPELMLHRKTLTEYYSRELAGLGFRPLKASPDCENVILRYPVRVANKDEVVRSALSRRVEIGTWFEIPLHPGGIDMEQFGYTPGMCPESEKACREVINLPTHDKITPAEADNVLSFLKECAKPA